MDGLCHYSRWTSFASCCLGHISLCSSALLDDLLGSRCCTWCCIQKVFYYLFQQSKNYKISDIKTNQDIIYLTLSPNTNVPQSTFNPVNTPFFPWRTQGGTPFGHETSGEHVIFAIKTFGSFTRKLSHLHLDTVVTLRGPYGTFANSLTQAPQVWIAGGIGITPFVSMLNQITPSQSVTLLWSCRDNSLVEIEKIFRNFDHSHSNFKLILINTCNERHIDIDLIKENDLLGGIHRYYLCGPINMMTDISQQLISTGVKKKHINFEDFSFK
jgi:predicted ferric reductase